VPLGHIERILENVNHDVAAETCGGHCSQSNTATDQTAARSTKLTQQRFEIRKSPGHDRISSD